MQAVWAGCVDKCGFVTYTLPLPLSFRPLVTSYPDKFWLSRTSAAITYSAGWKEKEWAKKGNESTPF
jgi:hypothetical protein